MSSAAQYEQHYGIMERDFMDKPSQTLPALTPALKQALPALKPTLNPALTPALQEVVADILALRAMARNDHFVTSRAQRELLGKLNPQDLAVVARALAAEEARQQPIYKK
jgi:hypothetical protein